jgi:hypothetical protein
MERKYIAVDFDGTCVTHEFPNTGVDIGAGPVLRDLHLAGYKIILHTMRGGPLLSSAVTWFKDNQIPLYGVNYNSDQYSWTDSRKVFAHLYIDDMALGVPLREDELCERPYVDWVRVRRWLVEHNFL